MIFQNASSRAHRTTILINDEDWRFIKPKGLKPTNLLRKKIQELRMREAGERVDWEASAQRLQAKLERTCEAMAKVLTKKQFSEILKS